MSIQNKSVERILAGVGGGGHPLIETDAELRTITGEKPRDLAGRYMEFVRHYFNDISNQTACIKNEIIYDAEINVPPLFQIFKDAVNAHSPDRLYYFNANHLGSGSLITDKNGDTYQTLIYAPHGEVLYNKFYGDYDEPYKFTGYEKDNESGLNYAKARYHEVNIGFNSTDAKWYLSPHQTSYIYAGNNPVMFRDPDGRIIMFASGTSVIFMLKYYITRSFMKSKGTDNIFKQLDANPSIIFLKESKNESSFVPSENTINWDPAMGALFPETGVIISPATVLNHEADHALQELTNPQQKAIDKNNTNTPYGNKEEERVITGSEQETARKHGEITDSEVTRTNHKGVPYETTSPTSTEGELSITIYGDKKEDVNK